MYERLVTQTRYEWDFESFDEYGDIVDHDFHDNFPGLPTEEGVNLVLVRDVGEGYNSDPLSFHMVDRTWAYVVDGKLPTGFDDGTPIPKRFYKHVPKGTEAQRRNW